MIKNNTKRLLCACLMASVSTQCIGDLIHTNQIRSEGLQADRDFVMNNAALNNTLNIKPISGSGYLKSLDDQINREKAQAEAQKINEMKAIDTKWANEAYKNYQASILARRDQASKFNTWAKQYYPQLLQQAREGNAAAMYTYSWLLSTHDPERRAWLRSAAEAGHVGAVSELGWLYLDEAFRKRSPISNYFKDNEYVPGEYQRLIKYGSVEYWTRAADHDDPSALAMCAMIYYAGATHNDDKSLDIPQDRKKAAYYLDRLEKIGAFTLHDIIAPCLVEYSFFQLLFHQEIHPHLDDVYSLISQGDIGDDWGPRVCQNNQYYKDYTSSGLHESPNLSNIHLEMIKLETYPTLWHTRQAAMKGDQKAIAKMIEWGKNHHIETNLDPTLKYYNQWMMQSNLGAIQNKYGYAFAPEDPLYESRNRVNPYKPGFYMNERELAYWTQKLQ